MRDTGILWVAKVPQRSGSKLSEKGRLRPVPRLFWLTSLAAWVAVAMSISLANPMIQQMGLAIMLVGGLPHGGHDLLLAIRRWSMGGGAMSLFIAAYIAVAAVMAGLWHVAPVAAMVLFLLLSAVHFSQDWEEPREPLLRFACGLAPIVAAAIGNADDVRLLFTGMAGEGGAALQSVLVMLAPVTLLVAATGLVTAWRKGERAWTAGQTLAIAQLILLPPLIAFPIYFAFLHSHRHIVEIARIIPDRLHPQAGLWAAGLALAAMALWWLTEPSFVTASGGVSAALAFQLLSVVALPHLVFDWLSQRKTRAGSA